MPSVRADLTISIGGLLWNGDSDTNLYALLRLVEQAMRRAKKAGRGQYIWVEADKHTAVGLDGQNADQALRLAIESRGLWTGEFEPYYQPLYYVRDDVPSSAEVLVRWRHPELGLLTPDQFLPFFEGSGLIVNLDLYMFECNCKNLRQVVHPDDLDMVYRTSLMMIESEEVPRSSTVLSVGTAVSRGCSTSSAPWWRPINVPWCKVCISAWITCRNGRIKKVDAGGVFSSGRHLFM